MTKDRLETTRIKLEGIASNLYEAYYDALNDITENEEHESEYIQISNLLSEALSIINNAETKLDNLLENMKEED